MSKSIIPDIFMVYDSNGNLIVQGKCASLHWDLDQQTFSKVATVRGIIVDLNEEEGAS